MGRFGRFVADHALLVLAAVALVTLAALAGILDPRSGRVRLEVDPSVERLLPEGDDERRFFDRARQLFGADEFVAVLLSSERDVFEPDVLARVQALTRELEARYG